MDLTFVINHIQNREYMSGVERDKSRVKQTEECFTHNWIVQKGLDEYEKLSPGFFSDPTKTWIDNSCGDGQWLGEVLIRKMENGIDFEQALATIFGVDLMQDNVELCRERLLCGREDLRHIVQTNIVNADALRYTYKFLGPGEKLYDDGEAKGQEFEGRLNILFDFG
jgi:hypothetical protein